MRGYWTTDIGKLELKIGEWETLVASQEGVIVKCSFEHEDAIKGNEDEPPTQEYFCIDTIIPTDNIFLSDGLDVRITLGQTTDLIYLLSERDVEKIENLVLKELREREF